MDARRLVIAVMGGLALSACAVMDPYIRHGREPNARQVGNCTNPYPSDAALGYACSMIVRMERARSAVTRTRSGLTATLFPIAGIVGYNSSRGFNAPTNAALTSGGLAGYSVVTTLAQPDRIRVYDNGLKSTSCAVGLYRRAIATQPVESLDRALLRENLLIADTHLVGIRKFLERGSAESRTIDGISRLLETMHQAAAKGAPERGIGEQLMEFVLKTVSEVNSQLTLTVPSNADAFSGAIDVFHADDDAHDGTATRKAMKAMLDQIGGGLRAAGVSADELASLSSRMALLIELLERIQAAAPDSRTIDFTPCAYTTLNDVGTQIPSGKLMLGAADSLNNTTITLKAKETRSIRIYGGMPPYDKSVTGPEPLLSADIEGDSGVSNLVLVAPDRASEERTYDITVTDAAGRYAKFLHVKVPAASPAGQGK